MKRVIATTNKRESLQQFATRIKNSIYTSNKYTVVPNLEENTVDVYEVVGVNATGKIIERYTLDTKEDEVTRYMYRKATSEDVAAGVPLFVKEPYVTSVSRQIPKQKRVDSIGSRYEED